MGVVVYNLSQLFYLQELLFDLLLKELTVAFGLSNFGGKVGQGLCDSIA